MNRGDSLAALEGLVGNHDHHHGQLVSPHMYVRMYVCMYVCVYIFTMCICHLTLHTYVCIVRSLNLRSDTEQIKIFSLLRLCILSMQPSRFHPFCPLCAGYTTPLTPHITSLLIRGH